MCTSVGFRGLWPARHMQYSDTNNFLLLDLSSRCYPCRHSPKPMLITKLMTNIKAEFVFIQVTKDLPSCSGWAGWQPWVWIWSSDCSWGKLHSLVASSVVPFYFLGTTSPTAPGRLLDYFSVCPGLICNIKKIGLMSFFFNSTGNSPFCSFTPGGLNLLMWLDSASEPYCRRSDARRSNNGRIIWISGAGEHKALFHGWSCITTHTRRWQDTGALGDTFGENQHIIK